MSVKAFTDVGAFIGSVAHHWVAVVGGAAISVSLLAWQAVGGPTLSERALWLIFAAGGAVSLFRAWQDEHHARRAADTALRTALDARPCPTVAVRVDKSTVWLDVRNEGAQGVFHAQLAVAVDGKEPVHGVCVWEPIVEGGAPLAFKMSARVKLAVNVEGGDGAGHTKTVWRVSCRAPGGRVSVVECGLRDVGDREDTEFARLTVVLRADPEMRQGSEVREYRLVGSCFVDDASGERHHVPPQHVQSARRGVATIMRSGYLSRH